MQGEQKYHGVSIMTKKRKFAVHNEFTQLKEAIVCKPTHYQIVDPINPVEAYYFKIDPPSREGMIEEHDKWTQLLEKLGVKLSVLESVPGLPHQLFTRDVGFTVGQDFFLSNMAKETRKGETIILKKWLVENKVPFQTMDQGFIEGGDVLVHYPYLYVGLSQRTNREGVQGLEEHLGPEWKVIPIRLAPEVLHLDCVLAILNPGTIIWCPDLILSHKPLIAGTFKNPIEISKEEAFHMAANILTVNPDDVLVEARHTRLHQELRKVGVYVHPLDWTEIKKLGGLFRCATCPIA